MNILYLGGWFVDQERMEIINNSKGCIQFAADALQQSILRGLLDNKINVKCVNLPYVGTFPLTYKKPFMYSQRSRFKDTSVFNIGFVNVLGLKRISRFVSALYGLFKCNKFFNSDEKNIILIYAIHTPFLLAASVFKFIHPNIKICVCVPDLPEYMGEYGYLKTIFKKIDSFIAMKSLINVNYYMLLTDCMINKLPKQNKKWCVVEGVFDESLLSERRSSTSRKKIILYTGTLAKRYGILTLLNAFNLIQDHNYELQICGDGDAKEILKSMALVDNRINYLGQLDRSEIIRLQQEATLLVNPRHPEGEYTMYSFPSKTMEYFASGTPVLLYRLGGIPKDYFNYCYTLPDTADANCMANKIIEICSLSADVLDNKGLMAREFIKINKNSMIQLKQLIDIL